MADKELQLLQAAQKGYPAGKFEADQEARFDKWFDRLTGFIKFIFTNPPMVIALKYVIFFLALFLLYLYIRNRLKRPVFRRPGQMRQRRQNCLMTEQGCPGALGALPFSDGVRDFGYDFYKGANEYARYDPKDYVTLQARPAHAPGRCDNAAWVEVGDRCAAAALPAPIEWKLNAAGGAEVAQLSRSLRLVLSKFDTVVVPWRLAGDYLVPDCGAAHYAADPERQPVLGLEDEGATCRRTRVAPDAYGERWRHKDAPLDDWSEIEAVDCGGEVPCEDPANWAENSYE